MSIEVFGSMPKVFLKFGSVPNLPGDIWSTAKGLEICHIRTFHECIWSMPNGPGYLDLLKKFSLRKHLWIQIAYNVYLHFCFTGLIHKKYSRFTGNCVVAVVTIIRASVYKLEKVHGVRYLDQILNCK